MILARGQREEINASIVLHPDYKFPVIQVGEYYLSYLEWVTENYRVVKASPEEVKTLVDMGYL